MYIGFDTSNYTTSVATYDGKTVCQAKQVLTVKPGERGLRQSDAVFQHTVNMPKLCKELEFEVPQAVGVSTRPRNVDGSYMPCFLVGENVATVLSSVNDVPMYKTSHQIGHILAALYSADMLKLINQRFIAFHLSGGTTEALIVEPDDEEIIKATVVAQSTDLKAGQAVDRTGVMLGMTFPCGKELDALSQKSEKNYKIKPTMLNGDCSLSGVENKARNMIDKGESHRMLPSLYLLTLPKPCRQCSAELCKSTAICPLCFQAVLRQIPCFAKLLTKDITHILLQASFRLITLQARQFMRI